MNTTHTHIQFYIQWDQVSNHDYHAKNENAQWIRYLWTGARAKKSTFMEIYLMSTIWDLNCTESNWIRRAIIIVYWISVYLFAWNLFLDSNKTGVWSCNAKHFFLYVITMSLLWFPCLIADIYPTIKWIICYRKRYPLFLS